MKCNMPTYHFRSGNTTSTKLQAITTEYLILIFYKASTHLQANIYNTSTHFIHLQILTLYHNQINNVAGNIITIYPGIKIVSKNMIIFDA